MIDGDLLRAFAVLRACGPDDAENLLYNQWFHDNSQPDRDFPSAAAYRAATLDRDRFEAGWRVIYPALDAAGAVVAEKDNVRRMLAPPECAPEQPGCLRFAAGARLLADPLSGLLHNGFWHLSPPAWRQRPPQRRQRLYFAVAPGHEIPFARAFVARAPLNRNWSVKMLCGRHSAGRRDAAVLYLDEGEPLDHGWVADLLADAGSSLTDAVPCLTRPLSAGVGWAPDPGDDVSYGQLLCRTLAAIAAEGEAQASEATWLALARPALAKIVPDGAGDG